MNDNNNELEVINFVKRRVNAAEVSDDKDVVQFTCRVVVQRSQFTRQHMFDFVQKPVEGES